MAEAILSRFGADKFNSFSAGSRPKSYVHPLVLQKLKNLNYRPDIFRPKSWEEFSGRDAPELDFVFTVCDNAANEVCPIWPGQPITAHWSVPDPTAARGTGAEVAFAFDNAWRMLQNRITLFCNLPIDKLDRLSLQNRLDEIGRNGSMRLLWSI